MWISSYYWAERTLRNFTRWKPLNTMENKPYICCRGELKTMLKPTVLGKNIFDTQTDVFKESNQQWLFQFKQNHQKVEGNRTRNSILSESQKLGSLYLKVRSGGEPDLVLCDVLMQGLIFMDFSAESPAGRRSLCFNQKAIDGRNENKSRVSALTMAEAMEISTLTEHEYQRVQNLKPLDSKTSNVTSNPERG